MRNALCALALAQLPMVLSGQRPEYQAGVIYGPKAAFEISAPEGWVLDNTSGRSNGLDCVLYLSGSTWQSSPVIMYAKVASTQFERVEDFLEFTHREYEKDEPAPTLTRMPTVAINDTLMAIVESNAGGVHDSYEATAYVQVPGAVCYIVFSARNEAGFRSYAQALSEAVRTFRYRPEYIGLEKKIDR